MTDAVEPLVLDMLEWIGPGPRPYAEVIEARRMSCPRLPVWEEAGVRGFIDRHHSQGGEALVCVSPAGLAHLRACRAWAGRGSGERAH